jgi:antitoxin StbD
MQNDALQRLNAHIAVSVSDLKRSPSSIIDAANGETVAVLNHNRVMAYMVAPAMYEAMLDRLDDQTLIDLVRARSNEAPVLVALDEL